MNYFIFILSATANYDIDLLPRSYASVKVGSYISQIRCAFKRSQTATYPLRFLNTIRYQYQ